MAWAAGAQWCGAGQVMGGKGTHTRTAHMRAAHRLELLWVCVVVRDHRRGLLQRPHPRLLVGHLVPVVGLRARPTRLVHEPVACSPPSGTPTHARAPTIHTCAHNAHTRAPPGLWSGPWPAPSPRAAATTRTCGSPPLASACEHDKPGSALGWKHGFGAGSACRTKPSTRPSRQLGVRAGGRAWRGGPGPPHLAVQVAADEDNLVHGRLPLGPRLVSRAVADGLVHALEHKLLVAVALRAGVQQWQQRVS